MKREFLTAKLERIIKQIETEPDLPLTIGEVHIFGSYARGDEDPGDLDLVLVHEKLTPEQEKVEMDSIFGYTTTPSQKMNGRLKARRENIDILYGPTFEAATSRAHGMGVHFKVWSKEDHDWRSKLTRIESPSPQQRVAILEQEVENMRRSIAHLQENVLAFQLARSSLDVESFRKFEEARYSAIDQVRKERMIDKKGLELL